MSSTLNFGSSRYALLPPIFNTTQKEISFVNSIPDNYRSSLLSLDFFNTEKVTPNTMVSGRSSITYDSSTPLHNYDASKYGRVSTQSYEQPAHKLRPRVHGSSPLIMRQGSLTKFSNSIDDFDNSKLQKANKKSRHRTPVSSKDNGKPETLRIVRNAPPSSRSVLISEETKGKVKEKTRPSSHNDNGDENYRVRVGRKNIASPSTNEGMLLSRNYSRNRTDVPTFTQARSSSTTYEPSGVISKISTSPLMAKSKRVDLYNDGNIVEMPDVRLPSGNGARRETIKSNINNVASKVDMDEVIILPKTKQYLRATSNRFSPILSTNECSVEASSTSYCRIPKKYEDPNIKNATTSNETRQASLSTPNESIPVRILPKNSPAVSNANDEIDHLIVGLRNLGNTCFMNSIIQCLAASKSLVRPFLDKSFENDLNRNADNSSKGKLAQSTGKLFRALHSASSGGASLTPSSFKNKVDEFLPFFSGYDQQDAQEFLICLLDALHEDLNRVKYVSRSSSANNNDIVSVSEKAQKAWKDYRAKNDSLIVDLFVGQLRSTVECQECGFQSITFDPFWSISVPVPKGVKNSLTSNPHSFNRNAYEKSCTLEECLQEFSTAEVLDGDEAYECSHCKKRCRSIKQLAIHKLPHLLVIHIKRFFYSQYRREKLCTDVSFPEHLDLAEFVPRNKHTRYRLYAVSSHVGGLGSGHYTATVRNYNDARWSLVNDSNVSEATIPSGPSAYVLFYELEH